MGLTVAGVLRPRRRRQDERERGQTLHFFCS